jgi:hypothetical protein
MMDKKSNENIPCTYCDKDAIPGTEPPVCKDHLEQRKEASEGPVTLKELDSAL